MSCLQQSELQFSYMYPTLDSAYDLELQDDTLYVANGVNGLKILKINLENTPPLNSIFEGNLVSEDERFVDVIVSENYLFLLEKLEFTNATTYILNRKFPINSDNYANLNCHRYQSKVVFSGVTDFSDDDELIIVRKELDAFGDYYNRNSFLFAAPFAPAIGWVNKGDCVDIELNKYNEDGINFLYDECDLCQDDLILDCAGECGGTAYIDNCGECDDNPSNDCLDDCNGVENGTALVDVCGICSGGNTGLNACSVFVDCNGVENGNSYLNNCGDCISILNYNLSDIEYYKRNNDEYLYLTNSNEKFSSVQIFIRESQKSFNFFREDTLSNKPLTIKVYENSYIVGLDDNQGACISSFDLNGNVEFECIAGGLTIQDIRYDYSTSLLTLSAGYDGVMVYDWSGDGDDKPTPRAMIASGYAYSALVYDNNRLIVGTKNGIEIYEF